MYIKLIKNPPKQDGTTTWRLTGVEWIDGKEKYIPVLPSTYSTMGIPSTLTVDEARARVKEINKSNSLKERERKRAIIAIRESQIETQTLIYLPKSTIEEFETHLAASYQQPQMDRKLKLFKMWNAALKIMRESVTEPEDWFDKSSVFFNLFLKYKFSSDYGTRILGIINQYGYFYCRKFKKPFLPIPKWNRKQRQKLQSAANTRPDSNKKSGPLRPEDLEAQRGNLIQEQYWWLKYSIWFGLRPEEIDNLNDTTGKYWRVEYNDEIGVPILWIFQTKVEKWKGIPVFAQEQTELTERLEKGEKVKRPLLKTIKRYFPEKTKMYGGRKAYVRLMKRLGQQPLDISRWLGHSNINRTLKDYMETSDVSFTPIKKDQ